MDNLGPVLFCCGVSNYYGFDVGDQSDVSRKPSSTG